MNLNSEPAPRLRRSLRNLAVATLTVVGCGPVYETVTDYEPPANPTARASLSNCELIRMQCTQIEESRADGCLRNCQARVDACEQRAEADYQRCASNEARRAYCTRARCENTCASGACSPKLDNCKRQYDRCYTAAGGTVTTRTMCVARCEPEAGEQTSNPQAGGTDTAEPPVKSAAALTDDACLESDECSKFGRCSAVDGVCAATNNAGCRQSLRCKIHKKCIAKGGECVK